MSMDSYDQETQHLREQLEAASSQLETLLIDSDVPDEAKTVAYAVRELGLRIDVTLRERLP